MSQKADEIIKRNIIDQLAWNDSVRAENIEVEIHDKIVKLTGTVPGYSDKITATRDAMQVARGYDIDNQISVEFEPTENVPADTEITENIQNFLKWNSNVNPVKIQVNVEKGHVTLSGTVSASWEKSQTEKIANSARGVVDVTNRISVKPMAIRKDEYIEKDIKRAFERSTLVDEDAVIVEVENGVVTLSGRVLSEPVLNEIYEKAISTNGVVDVVNEITIG